MESEWIVQAQNGDTSVYQIIVERYREIVFRLAYLLLGDADDAEDVTQETFIRAYNNLSRYDCSRSFRPWILRITANLAKNRKRSLGRYWAMLQRFAQSELGNKSPDIEAKTIQEQDAQSLWMAIRQLKTSEQEIIYLRYFLDLSVEETANTLNIKIGTVKSRLHRALKQLRFVVDRDFPLLRSISGDEHYG